MIKSGTNRGIDLARERAEQSEADWQFGGLSQPCIALIPEAVRESFLPLGEKQNLGEEKLDCASRAPLNILEAKFTWLIEQKKMLPQNEKWLRDNGYCVGKRIVFSDRFVAINSGTTRSGNSLKSPLEAIRKQGLIPKAIFKQVESFDEYHDKGKITSEMTELGLEFTKRFTINYEQVKEIHYGELLKDDFLDVGGYAWPSPVNGEYPRAADFLEPNHAFVVYRLPKFLIFDNYLDWDIKNENQVEGDFTKKLAQDYDFWDYGYRVYISREVSPDERIPSQVFSVLEKYGLLSFFEGWYQWFIKRT